MVRWSALVLAVSVALAARAQTVRSFADSLRGAHQVPAIGYAVVSTDSLLAIGITGVCRAGTDEASAVTDHFRIGSVTKTITALVVEDAVRSGALKWDDRLLDVLPELRAGCRKAYRQATVLDLLRFQVPLYAWTYTDTVPRPEQLKGDVAAQRLALLHWALQRPPRRHQGSYFSNLSYVAVGCMLERATGHTFEQLVQAWAERHQVDVRFGAPNQAPNETWGHFTDGTPQPPGSDVKLDWLLAAGGISLDLADHARIVQMQLQRASRIEDGMLRSEGGEMLAWRRSQGEDGVVQWYHVGNPGTFLTKVFLHPASDRAFILYANQQSPDADEALDALHLRLVRSVAP